MTAPLYCPPWARVYVDKFERSEELQPRADVIAPRVNELPPRIRAAILHEFERRAPAVFFGEQTVDAPDWLRAITARLIKRKLAVAFDVEHTREYAQQLARIADRERTYELIERVVKYKGLEMPKGNKKSTPASLVKRARDPKVWRRVIETTQTRDAENCLREIGFIERRSQLYCTDLALSWFRGKMRAQTEYLKSHAVDNGKGEQLSLFEVHQKSVSNPAIRRAELMTRMSGFEELARAAGHVAEFITLTCPSEYHSMHADGRVNNNFKGHSVRDAQAWLSKMWTRSRSKLARLSILVYGFRVAEPHHDGTPHWHMVLFTAPSDLGALRTVLRGYWLSDSGSEPGAAHHRIKFESINYAKGSATGYISKYVAKNIDGFEVGADYEASAQTETGDFSGTDVSGIGGGADPRPAKTDATNTVARVRTWASLHGIRQFQQIGGPTVTLYRELRRCRNVVDVAPIERARVPADAGDWAGYVEAVGGIEAGRVGPLSLWTDVTKEWNGYGESRNARNAYDEERGPQIVGIRIPGAQVRTPTEAWQTGECNSFDECRGAEIKGILSSCGGSVATRAQTWRIVRVFSESSLGPVAITVRDGLSLANPHGWTNPNETSMYGPH